MTVNEFFALPNSPNIFSNSVVADLRNYANYSGLTGQDVANVICEKFGDLYINGNPTIAGWERAIDIWHSSRKYYFDGLLETTQYEYNPIYNYNLTETQDTTRTPDLTHEISGEDEQTVEHGLTVSTTDTTTGENDVTTYTAGTFLNDTSTTQTLTGTTRNTGTDTTGNTTNRTETETGTDTTETVIEKSGNVGVTSTQDMIKQQRDILNIDLFDIWIERFAERFLIPIYNSETERGF